MSLLNRPSDGLASVVIALRRTLLAYGPLPPERLLSIAAPPAVAKSDMARKTLTRWMQLGAFEERDGRVLLRDELSPPSLGADDVDELRAALLRIVLAQENNPLVDKSEEDGDGRERSLASDFTRAAAWALAQDVHRFPGNWTSAEKLQDEQQVAPPLFANNTRWDGFVEWAAFLGVGWMSRAGLVPDPTAALLSRLDVVFGGAPELPLETFLGRLATELPILDGGRYRTAVEASIGRPWRTRAPLEISPSLSTALRHLDASGALRFEDRADAPQWTFLGRGGREVRKVTHTIRLQDTK